MRCEKTKIVHPKSGLPLWFYRVDENTNFGIFVSNACDNFDDAIEEMVGQLFQNESGDLKLENFWGTISVQVRTTDLEKLDPVLTEILRLDEKWAGILS